MNFNGSVMAVGEVVYTHYRVYLSALAKDSVAFYELLNGNFERFLVEVITHAGLEVMGR